MNKKVLAATCTLVGSIIGAGILGLPFVFARSGFFVGLFWLVFLGLVLLLVNLYFAEVALSTRQKHQLTGYATKYLGSIGRMFAFAAVIFGIYAALVAYIIGESQSIALLLPGSVSPLVTGVFFWLIMTLILREGLRGLKKVETYGVFAIVAIIFWLAISLFPEIAMSNISHVPSGEFASAIGVILFALLGFTAIPEVRQEMVGSEKHLKRVIIYGSVAAIVLYAIFSFTFVGVLGNSVSEIATLSFGPLLSVLGIFTMLTSYLVLSFALKDTFKYDLKLSPFAGWVLTAIVPLLGFIIITMFGLVGFSSLLGFTGVISAGVTAILIVLMSKQVKKRATRKSEITMPINWPIIIAISALFIVATILQFAS